MNSFLQNVNIFSLYFVPDGCDPLVYRVLDDHRRSVQYKNANSDGGDSGLLCDDLLPFGWYRFLAYGMYVK